MVGRWLRWIRISRCLSRGSYTVSEGNKFPRRFGSLLSRRAESWCRSEHLTCARSIGRDLKELSRLASFLLLATVNDTPSQTLHALTTVRLPSGTGSRALFIAINVNHRSPGHLTKGLRDPLTTLSVPYLASLRRHHLTQ